MKHLTFGDKTLFIDDEAAAVLLQYAAALANTGHADTVQLHAIGPDGNEVDASFLLDAGTNLMTESAENSLFQEPDNSETISYMREQLVRRQTGSKPVAVSPDELKEMERNFAEDIE